MRYTVRQAEMNYDMHNEYALGDIGTVTKVEQLLSFCTFALYTLLCFQSTRTDSTSSVTIMFLANKG